MDFTTFNTRLNALVTEFLDRGGDPAQAAGLMREIADEVFEEPDEDSSPEDIRQASLW
jgi:uncharacterized protein YpuA (DUF1002 family)